MSDLDDDPDYLVVGPDKDGYPHHVPRAEVSDHKLHNLCGCGADWFFDNDNKWYCSHKRFHPNRQ